MRYDTVIIGGGLSGLVAGIRLAQRQQKVAIVSSGQSALHFSSGSFGLLGFDGNGNPVDNPLEQIKSLPEGHPYSRIGAERVGELADEVTAMFAEAGITLKGSARKNHRRLTPLGFTRPCWLSLSDFFTMEDASRHNIKSCLTVNFRGFLDFYPDFIANGLKAAGIDCRNITISIEQLERLRHSATEMRAASIARQLKGKVLEELAGEINRNSHGCDAVLVPAVIGFDSEEQLNQLRESVDLPLFCIPTTPMSVCGLRMQNQLRRRFQRLGGNYLLGDIAVDSKLEGHRLASVETAALGSDYLEAENYILAGGGLFGHGIIAEPHRFYEPLIGVEVDAPSDRQQWFEHDFFARQLYMSYGVKVDGSFRPSYKNETLDNVRAVGAIIGGHDSLNEGSGAGVAVISAMHVADQILK